MFYFIPAWYNSERKWYDDTPPWFRVFERMRFDDTVNQLKMFLKAEESSSLLILNYQPQLRYFLHKQDLLGSTYWSFFDEIQNISVTDTNPISFKHLNWPKNTRFLYTPFAVVAKQGARTLAYIHFAENGNLLYIDFQKDNRSDKHYIFDDRGFLSSILYHDELGFPSHQDYLNPNGVWQVREHLSEHQAGIEVNPVADNLFQERYYASWEDLIIERLALLEKEMSAEDVLVIANHPQHNVIICDSFPKQKKVVSFFTTRSNETGFETLALLAKEASLLVVDTKKQEQELQEALLQLGETKKIISRISPFDTRLRLGHSQMVKELILYFYIDRTSDVRIKSVLLELMQLMEQNPLLEVKVVTIEKTYPLSALKDWVSDTIHQSFDIDRFFQVVEDTGENQLEEDEELELTRIHFEYFSNENQLIEALDTARLVIDLGQEPDLYTQIASISAGIPQIHCAETEYVTHLKNGWVLGEQDPIAPAIQYYVEGLANWNAALVYAVQKMADYTSGRILSQWKALLDQES